MKIAPLLIALTVGVWATTTYAADDPTPGVTHEWFDGTCTAFFYVGTQLPCKGEVKKSTLPNGEVMFGFFAENGTVLGFITTPKKESKSADSRSESFKLKSVLWVIKGLPPDTYTYGGECVEKEMTTGEKAGVVAIVCSAKKGWTQVVFNGQFVGKKRPAPSN